MFTWYRTASIAPGRVAKTMAFATEISAYVKEKTGVEVRVAVPVSGNPNRVGWSSRYDSLAKFEATMAKLMGDPKYMETVAKNADNFVAGSVHDEFWRDV